MTASEWGCGCRLEIKFTATSIQKCSKIFIGKFLTEKVVLVNDLIEILRSFYFESRKGMRKETAVFLKQYKKPPRVWRINFIKITLLRPDIFKYPLRKRIRSDITRSASSPATSAENLISYMHEPTYPPPSLHPSGTS